MKDRQLLKRIAYIALPVIGILFLILYIRAAGEDVVYSDYIRLVAEYLPDVRNAGKFFVPDILTRIPVTFLMRIINVEKFGFSVTFDRMLGACGMAIMAFVLMRYFIKYEINFWWQAIIYAVLFSLNKWEILLNGSAWAHVVSFGLFFISYYLLSKIWKGESTAGEELAACLMPPLMLLTAGEYIASYCVTVILTCIFGVLTGGTGRRSVEREQKLFRAVAVSAAASLMIYMLSRHFAVWEHSGAADISFLELIGENPLFLIKFFLKSFAGAVIGQETIANFFGSGAALPGKAVAVIGVIMLLAYLLAFVIYIRCEIFEITIFPLMLLISGFINHVLVTASRWIFLNDNYALSSRYSGQFMIGLIGMLIIFSMYRRQKRVMRGINPNARTAMNTAVILAVVLIISGNCYTTYQEVRKAPYREANYARMAEVIRTYEAFEEDALKAELEWTKDSETLYKALKILKDNKLNVFNQ